MARAGPEGQTRLTLAHQEARAEPAAWQAARAAPAGQEAWVTPAGWDTWEAPAGQGVWAAPSGRWAWEAPAGWGTWVVPAGWWAWEAPAGRGAWAAPAGRGAWAAQGQPPGRQRALKGPPGLEGWKKLSSSSSVSENGMPRLLRPPLGALQIRRPPLGKLHPLLQHQPLCCVAELLGKHPYVSALLTEGAQGLELEDALVEGAG